MICIMLRCQHLLNKYDVIVIGGGPSGLLLSSLLAQMNVRTCVVEKRLNPTAHPQAHFIGARSMEILQMHMKDVYSGIVEQAAPHKHWRYNAQDVLGKSFLQRFQLWLFSSWPHFLTPQSIRPHQYCRGVLSRHAG